MKKVYLAFVLCLILLTGCVSKEKEYTVGDDLSVKTKDIEVFSDIYLKDIIDSKEYEIISDNYKIDTEVIGTFDYELIYKKDNQEYLYKYSINVIDNEAPKVFSGTNKSIVKGFTGELCDLISYGDNYDGNINCKIEGSYSVNKVGTYSLKYILSDSSNNEKTVNVTLNVLESSPKQQSNTSTRKTSFTDVVAKYKNDSNEVGIDVSKWQGNIDFNRVKNAGASFVMMRIGVQKSTLGELEIDPYYLENIKKAKEAGLKVGVYLYSMAISSDEAIEHANWVLKTLDNEKLDLPIVFDWESWSKWNSFKISFHEINKIANNYMSTVKKAGYDGMLYSSKFYLENIWENKLDFPVWLAHYTEKTNYKGKYVMWQLCNNGRIDGINGDVDIDILYN